MKREVLDIGVLWNEASHRAFHVQAFETRDDGQGTTIWFTLSERKG